jgi:hypothetical protein
MSVRLCISVCYLFVSLQYVYCELPKVIRPTGSFSPHACDASHSIVKYDSKLYPQVVIYHIHVPKTGGTTIADLLQCRDSRAGSKSTSCTLHTTQADYKMINRNKHSFISCEVRTMNEVRRTISNITTEKKLLTVSMIRDPLDLTISGFLHMKRFGEKPCTSFDMIFKEKSKREKLCQHYDVRSMQTKVYSTGKRANISEAINFIKNDLFYFGITKYFRTSMCLLAFQLGQRVNPSLCDCSKLQVGEEKVVRKNAKPESQGLPEETSMNSILQLYKTELALDRILYDVALRIFLSRVSALEKKISFPLICENTDGVDIMAIKNTVD